MSVAAGVLFVSPVQAQSPEPRQTATEGASGVSASEPVWEPHIAAARPDPNGTMVNDKIVCAHNVGPRDGQLGVAFSIASNSGGTWSWQAGGLLAPPSGYQSPFDPTVAYNAITGDFVVCVALNPSSAPYRGLGVAHSTPVTSGPFDGGIVLIEPNLYWPGTVDKPTLVAGEMTSSIQECYIVTWKQGQPMYLRSINGGTTWKGGDISGTIGFVTPCTSADGRVYVAESGANTSSFKFFQGTDITDPNDPNFGKVTWAQMQTDNVDPPDPLTVPLNAQAAHRYLPLPFNHKEVYMWPKLAADPLDPNILYVAYNDLAAPNGRPDEDMDVYLRRLTRNPSTGYWVASGRVKVNDDNPDPNTIIDEFLPEIWVTHEPGQPAHVHVVFFTDRRFDEQIDNNPEYPKFDVYYARSQDGGLTFPFPDDRLYKYSATDPNDIPMIDYSKLPRDSVNKPYELNDYFGFTARVTTSGFALWAAPHCSDGQIDPGHAQSSRPVKSSERGADHVLH